MPMQCTAGSWTWRSRTPCCGAAASTRSVATCRSQPSSYPPGPSSSTGMQIAYCNFAAVDCSNMRPGGSVLSYNQQYDWMTITTFPLALSFRQYSEPNGSYPLLPTSQSEQATVYFRRCELSSMCLVKDMLESCVCLGVACSLYNVRRMRACCATCCQGCQRPLEQPFQLCGVDQPRGICSRHQQLAAARRLGIRLCSR